MAVRIAFRSTGKPLEPFHEELVAFEWAPGFAPSQKQKNIASMHTAIMQANPSAKPLEVSTRSAHPLGRALSAFNLLIKVDGVVSSVESRYQASKIFELGGPYLDLLKAESAKAKTDERLKSSGALRSFQHVEQVWSLSPSPNFYDFLYISALLQNPQLLDSLEEFDVFTDLAYSQTKLTQKQGKSFNCQARSIAIFKSVKGLVNLDEVMQSWRRGVKAIDIQEEGLLF